jgi:hypothetical protein
VKVQGLPKRITVNLLNSQVEICETQEVEVHATSIDNITTVVISAFIKKGED